MSAIVLSALEESAEKACRDAYRKRKSIDGPINWADLHVVSVERYEEIYQGTPDSGYRVWIEEAADSAYELHQFVANYLAKAGFPGVEVKTEW
jgi:hypothetical protein